MSTAPTTRPRLSGSASAGAARRWPALSLGVVIGLLFTYGWSHHFVDSTIGDNVANTLLGYNAKETAIAGAAAGAMFAFVTGLAGTFTACNVAALSALPSMLGNEASAKHRMRRALGPLAWLALAAMVVAMAYGALGVVFSERLPQLSDATTAAGMPLRLVQSTVVFGVIGVVLLYLGTAVLGILPNPMPRDQARAARAWMILMGVLIGGFLVGRPFPLFRQLFAHAAEVGNPLYGAAVFGLQTLGNIALLAAMFLLLAGPGVRLQRWLVQRPERAVRVTGVALAAAGTFTLVYWVLRVPARFGYGWFPMAPWVT